ncbi:Ig-like domain-containing protein, partial [Azotobacter salinestris]|uniref:Ig-like domain-containing protein n=1 Tax=Azotobacter salinestris TaxID=69964 RepID=UPI0032DFAA7F
LAGVADSAGVRVDAAAPTVVSILRDTAGPVTADSLSYTLTFDEAVSGLDAGDFVVVKTGTASGTVQSVAQLDERTYRITLGGVQGEGTLGLALVAAGSGIVDRAGNALLSGASGEAYVLLDIAGDPEFRTSPPAPGSAPVDTLPRPSVPALPPSPFESPLLPPSLFVPETLGGLPPLGNIFVHNGALAPSFIAQVFASSASGGNGGGQGFLGFGGGDGGVFGSSSLSGIFASGQGGLGGGAGGLLGRPGELGQDLQGIFGAPSLGQQLHDMGEAEKRQLHELAEALQRMDVPKAPA